MPENTEATPATPALVPNVDIPDDIEAALTEEAAQLQREQELGLSHEDIMELEEERAQIIQRLADLNRVLNG